MGNLQEEQKKAGEQIFNEVIEKKHNVDIDTKKIAKDLDLDKQEVRDYLSGLTKNNLSLGIMILDYLESKEQLLDNDYQTKESEWFYEKEI